MGQIMEDLHAAEKALTATVRGGRPREYLTEREVKRLMDAARANRWGHREQKWPYWHSPVSRTGLEIER